MKIFSNILVTFLRYLATAFGIFSILSFIAFHCSTNHGYLLFTIFALFIFFKIYIGKVCSSFCYFSKFVSKKINVRLE